MGQFASKQINKIISAYVKITGLAITSGTSSINVTSQLTSACSVAGEGGVAVPVFPSTATNIEGIAVTSPTNRVEVWDNTSQEKIIDSSGDEVYGRITYSSSVYTLSFYSLPSSGSETAYSFASNETIEFDFVYRFQFGVLPADSSVSIITRNVSQDPRGTSSIEVNEVLTVTALNTVSNLTYIPATSTRVKLSVNGKVESPLGGSPEFTVAGAVVTWNAANAGYSLETTDFVTAIYYI